MQITKRQSSLNLHLPIIIPAVILSIIGVITLVSTSVGLGSELSLPTIALKQIGFLVIGVLIYVLMSKFDYTYLKYHPILILVYVGTLTLLILTLIFGEEVKGAQRWLTIAGVQLQPSEFAKITVILITAYVMSLQKKYHEYILVPISLLLIVPILILVYMQPHGSMSILLLSIWGITVFFSLRDQLRNFLMLLLFGFVVVGIAGYIISNNSLFILLFFAGLVIYIYTFFSQKGIQALATIFFLIAIISGVVFSYSWNSILLPYQKERITTFITPESADPSSTFNVDQAKIAIGSGQIFGKGFGNGTQASRDFLPEHQTDFIFASYAEQAGFIGAIFLITMYLVILVSVFKYPFTHSGDIFATTLVIALGMKLLLEVFINLGTNMGITPATGIPLSLVSAGGSITIATFFSLGLIQSIMNQRSFIDN